MRKRKTPKPTFKIAKPILTAGKEQAYSAMMNTAHHGKYGSGAYIEKHDAGDHAFQPVAKRKPIRPIQFDMVVSLLKAGAIIKIDDMAKTRIVFYKGDPIGSINFTTFQKLIESGLVTGRRGIAVAIFELAA